MTARGPRVDPSEEPLTFVTVAFESERSLLLLHARSVARHLAPGLVGRIVVIDNSARGFGDSYRRRLLAEYADLAPRVSVVRRQDVAEIPTGLGWYVQQVLKLEIARQIDTRQYVVFDTKNIAVGPLRREFFQDGQGRARGIAYPYDTHPLRPGLERVLTYLGVEPGAYVHRFTATVTPFVFDTSAVEAMIDWVEERAGRPFGREFIDRDLLEFFLYAGYIVSTGRALDEVFALDRMGCPTVWPGNPSRAALRTALDQVQSSGSPIVSVHRKALAALDAEARTDLGEFWVQRQLFSDMDEFVDFIARFRREFAWQERRRKARELSTRVRRKLRS